MWAVVSSCGNRKSVQSYSHLEAGITEASWSTGEDGQWIAALEVEFDDHSVSRVEWNITGLHKILSSAGDDENLRMYKRAYGSVWRSIGRFSTERTDDGDEAMVRLIPCVHHYQRSCGLST